MHVEKRDNYINKGSCLKLYPLDLNMLTSMLNFKLWVEQYFSEQEQISKLKDRRNYRGVASQRRENVIGRQRHMNDRRKQCKEKRKNEGDAIF